MQRRGEHKLVPRLAGGMACALAAWIWLPNAVFAADDALDPFRLGKLSLEELANIEITSVSKRKESLADAAASVFVITGDDIRRSGYTRLPDILRLAPNLQVAQVSNTGYMISARGFNGTNNSVPNKLLVLIDGRSAYSPLFSGMFWDVQFLALEDIERIEVISGPGGTLWGVNAVNGVINLITRSARDTQGGLLAAEAGNRGSDETVRYGGKLGEDGYYRVYAKYVERRHSATENGSPVNDAYHHAQTGFRADWNRPGDKISVQANAYRGQEDQPAPGAIRVSGASLALGPIPTFGANLMAQWEHGLRDGASLSLQAYFDRTTRTIPPAFGEDLDILDLQVQHSLARMGAHRVVWGANLRQSWDRVANSAILAFLPADVNQRWMSLFAQDEIELRKDWKLTLGARYERNDYTGWEFLPSLRLAWKPDPDRLVWAAASRTVRAPTRLDHDAFIPGTPPFLLNGGGNVVSEVAQVYELGYRASPGKRTSYSMTLFHHDYDKVRTQEVAPSRTFVFFSNQMEGYASGVEMWGSYQAMPHWRLSAGMTALRERFRLKPGSNDLASLGISGNDPAYTAMLRSSFDLSARNEFDVIVRRVASLSNQNVPAYTAVDARWGWKIRPGLELSVSGQNLFGGGHAEYASPLTRSWFDRNVFMKLLAAF